MIENEIEMLKKQEGMRMSNHNKIRPVDKIIQIENIKFYFLHPRLKTVIFRWNLEDYKSIIVNL